MNSVMTNGFCELNGKEMMMVDGGWNGVQWFGGVACVVVGGFGAAAGLATYDAGGVVSGLGIAHEGVRNIYDSFFN